MGLVREPIQGGVQGLHQPLMALEIVVLVFQAQATIRGDAHPVVGGRQVLRDHQHGEHALGQGSGEAVGDQGRGQPV